MVEEYGARKCANEVSGSKCLPLIRHMRLGCTDGLVGCTKNQLRKFHIIANPPDHRDSISAGINKPERQYSYSLLLVTPPIIQLIVLNRGQSEAAAEGLWNQIALNRRRR